VREGIINVANKRTRQRARVRDMCAQRVRRSVSLLEARGSRIIEFSVETKTLGFSLVFLTLSANGSPHKSPLMAAYSRAANKPRKRHRCWTSLAVMAVERDVTRDRIAAEHAFARWRVRYIDSGEVD